jgi:glycerophosphoryl diester phosphodiesterase
LSRRTPFAVIRHHHQSVPGNYLPYFMRQSEAVSRQGDLRIPVPSGVPVSLLTNIGLLPDTEDPTKRAEYEKVVVRLVRDLKDVPRDAAEANLRAVFANLAGPLLALTKCPDFAVGRGHYFGSTLKDDDKRALIEFLKTF